MKIFIPNKKVPEICAYVNSKELTLVECNSNFYGLEMIVDGSRDALADLATVILQSNM